MRPSARTLARAVLPRTAVAALALGLGLGLALAVGCNAPAPPAPQTPTPTAQVLSVEGTPTTPRAATRGPGATHAPANPLAGPLGAVAGLPAGHPPTNGTEKVGPLKPGVSGALPPGHPPTTPTPRPAPRPVDPGEALPPGHPPLGGQAAPAAVLSDLGPRPLPPEGPGSEAELSVRLQALGGDARRDVEEAFRLTFTTQRERRDPARAAELLKLLVEDPVAGATAHRILGYVAVSSGFDVPRALKHYNQAIARDADYGEAHYALAFMYTMNDRPRGKVHFERAADLGVSDTRNIAKFFEGLPDPPGAPSPVPTPDPTAE